MFINAELINQALLLNFFFKKSLCISYFLKWSVPYSHLIFQVLHFMIFRDLWGFLDFTSIKICDFSQITKITKLLWVASILSVDSRKKTCSNRRVLDMTCFATTFEVSQPLKQTVLPKGT